VRPWPKTLLGTIITALLVGGNDAEADVDRRVGALAARRSRSHGFGRRVDYTMRVFEAARTEIRRARVPASGFLSAIELIWASTLAARG
jgi:hypothetical protein